MSRVRSLAKLVTTSKVDTDERIKALRLQAMAWRLLTMIALVDQERARAAAQWLLFRTVPFTDGAAVEAWIAENQRFAEECGLKARVFTKPATGEG